MSSEDVLKKFGRYFLLDRVAQGGMAEIYRSRLATLDGGGRLLVIKRIHSNYKSNAEFLEMFKSEIKLTVGFSHPNIVQLYDYGDSEGMPYIAMEFVDGKTIRQFAARFFKRKEMLPIDLVLSIMEQAARGLGYAHTYKDKITGKELNIVHRDISPQNIIISYDGVVKLIDFGIAKATTSVDLTRTGIIKGKPSYMAPEQVAGEELDGRSDVFSLGIVLWELLTGKKLFSTTGKSEYSILKMIEKCEKTVKPPSILNSNITPELDEIVMRALKKDRNERYSSAAEFQKALQRYLATHYPEFNISELPYWMDRLFSEDKKLDQIRIQELNQKAENLLRSEDSEFSGGGEVTSALFDRAALKPTEESSSDSLGEPEPLPEMSEAIEEKEIRRPPPEEKAPKAKLVKKTIPQKSSDLIELDNEPAAVVHLEDDQLKKSRDFQKSRAKKKKPINFKRIRWLATAAVVIAGFVYPEYLLQIPMVSETYEFSKNYYEDLQSGKRYLPILSEIVKPAKNATSDSTLGVPMESPPPAGEEHKDAQRALLTLRVTPAGLGTKISINGMHVEGLAPVIELPLNTQVELVVERPKFKTYKKDLVISPKDLTQGSEYQFEVVLEPEVFGYLSVKADLSAEVHVRELDPVTKQMRSDSGTWYFNTRFEQLKFPPGLYLVQLTNRALDMEAMEYVKVEKNLITRASLSLEETVSSNMTQVAPDRVLGLVAWFRANSITGVRQGDPIPAWNDSSRNLLQSTQQDPVRRPVLEGDRASGQTTLRFNGAGQSLDSDSLAAGLRSIKTSTVIFVARSEDSQRQGVIGCFKSNRNSPVLEIALAGDHRLQVRDNQSSYQTEARTIAGMAPLRNDRLSIYSTVFTSSSVLAFHNGKPILNARGSGVDFSNTAHCVVGQSIQNGKPVDSFKGEIAELIVYDHALSQREQANIELYLSRIYGIERSR